jgi:hypothetical protein
MREFGRILHEVFIHFSPAATVGFIYLRFVRVDQKTITEMSDEPLRTYIGRNIQLTMIRKLHILFTVFGLLSFVVNAQVVSIRPSMAVQGQTLTTTITCASGLFTQASPPMGMQDIYLQQGNTIITCNSFDPSVNIYGGGGWPFGWSDSLFTDFTIPLNVPSGYYDVHVTTYTTDPWNWMPIPSDNILQGGFFVGIAAGVLEGTVYFDSNQNGTALRRLPIHKGNTTFTRIPEAIRLVARHRQDFPLLLLRPRTAGQFRPPHREWILDYTPRQLQCLPRISQC